MGETGVITQGTGVTRHTGVTQHSSHLPGGRPNGVFLRVIVFFAHFFC